MLFLAPQARCAYNFQQPVGTPDFFSKNSPSAKSGPEAGVGRGARGTGASHPRAEPRTAPAPGRPAVAGSRVPGAARAASSSHGRDSGTFPLPPPLGLQGFAFHMAPGWGRWAQGSGCGCSRSGGPGEPSSLRTRPLGGWQQQHLGGALAGTPMALRGRPPSHIHLSPQSASFSVSATGWRAGEGSEARYSRGAGGGRGGHFLPALLRRRRRRRLERGAAGRRRGWVGASKSLTKGN